jgi:multiple sugar transport system substrate-binding protein
MVLRKLKKMQGKQILFSLVFFFILFVVHGCSPKQKESPSQETTTTVIKVAFWGSPDEIEIITDCLQDWEKAHPLIKIRFEHTPYGSYETKILTRIAGKVAPDVICTEVNQFVTFATAGVLYDLSSYISKDKEFNIKDFFPEVIDRFTRDKKTYAIPRDTAPFACVFYNKDIFDKAGVSYPADDWNWNDLLEKAKTLTKTDNSGRIEQYGFYGWAWQNFVYGNGGNLVDDVKNPTMCKLNSPLALEGLQFYADLINKYKVMPTPVALDNLGMGVDYMFASGRLAMFLSGIWETPGLRNYDFRWDVAMFPKNSKGIRRFGTGGSGYAILESSQHKSEAWEVVKALTAAQAQIQLAHKGLAQPARCDIAKGPDWATHPGLPENKKMLNEAVQYAVYDPFHPRWREIMSRYITPALELISNGQESPTSAIGKIIPKIDDLLKEAK